MNTSNKILSDITVFSKYAKYVPELERRETWDELVTRNKEMHQRKYPKFKKEIEKAYKYVYDKKILPSMRSLQFGGTHTHAPKVCVWQPPRPTHLCSRRPNSKPRCVFVCVCVWVCVCTNTSLQSATKLKAKVCVCGWVHRGLSAARQSGLDLRSASQSQPALHLDLGRTESRFRWVRSGFR